MKTPLTKEYLLSEYGKKTLKQISQETKYSRATIQRALQKFGIQSIKYPEINKDYLIDSFIDKNKSVDDIARDIGCSPFLIKKRLKIFNISKNEYKYKNLIGKMFGKWTVVGIEKTKNRRKAIVQCHCGFIKTLFISSLTKGTSSGCKLCTTPRGVTHNKWNGYEEISGTYWRRLFENAKKRKLEFNISIEYIWKLYYQSGKKCKLSCLPLTHSTSNKRGTASLDRIDSSIGYVEGNCQWLHKTINLMKQHLDEKEFINMCKLVAENNQ